MIFDDLTTLSKVFHIQKPLIFRHFFGSFLVPISGPPSGRSFWPILADQGADLASSGWFWAHFGDPGFSKKAPWATPFRPETSKKGGTPSWGFHPVAVMDAKSAPKGHQRPSVSIWDRFWSHLGLILDPWKAYFKQFLRHIGAFRSILEHSGALRSIERIFRKHLKLFPKLKNVDKSRNENKCYI